ncbi:hypothetical protein [Halobacillus karajensis]|uniref:Uncharacterized protein n=1 Tax=Halobacillus karajensis TaxID=195088 RepID=A0A059NXV2_9BACI|nr:hypothetical protein [Halobacillus karajensis]CDQ22626.1 hypothetical protein BN983_00839 [Halobacillus karajensis]CDQ26108.1 hypothetical protein BN981_00319 [Halobacillus karajensis]
MDETLRRELAKFLQTKLHDDYLPGFHFDEEDVDYLIEKFFKAKELIEERSEIQRKIDDILK